MSADVIATKGLRIRMLRFAKGMQVQELAAVAKMTPSHLSGIERGRTQGSPAALQRIAAALGVDPSELIGPAAKTSA